jgi:hypothetical protein
MKIDDAILEVEEAVEELRGELYDLSPNVAFGCNHKVLALQQKIDNLKGLIPTGQGVDDEI